MQARQRTHIVAAADVFQANTALPKLLRQLGDIVHDPACRVLVDLAGARACACLLQVLDELAQNEKLLRNWEAAP